MQNNTDVIYRFWENLALRYVCIASVLTFLSGSNTGYQSGSVYLGLHQVPWCFLQNKNGGSSFRSYELFIWSFCSRDHVISKGPCQPKNISFPEDKRKRKFLISWYDKFEWLEYSPAKDKAFCFYCRIFNSQVLIRNYISYADSLIVYYKLWAELFVNAWS